MAAPITELSILSYPDGFIFFETCNDRSQTFKLLIEAPIDFPENFENFVSSRKWTSDNKMNVCITEHSDRFLLLPDEIGDQNQKREFFDFMHTHVKGNILRTDNLGDGIQQFCYEVSEERLSCYRRMFTKFKLQSDAFTMLEWSLNKSTELQKPIVLTNVYKKSMQLFAVDKTGILFANSYMIQTVSEVTYFLLRCLEQTGLDPFEIQCNVCSDSENRNKIIESLQPYIKNLTGLRMSPQSKSIVSPVKA